VTGVRGAGGGLDRAARQVTARDVLGTHADDDDRTNVFSVDVVIRELIDGTKLISKFRCVSPQQYERKPSS